MNIGMRTLQADALKLSATRLRLSRLLQKVDREIERTLTHNRSEVNALVESALGVHADLARNLAEAQGLFEKPKSQTFREITLGWRTARRVFPEQTKDEQNYTLECVMKDDHLRQTCVVNHPTLNKRALLALDDDRLVELGVLVAEPVEQPFITFENGTCETLLRKLYSPLSI
jgi:hypothetical protein